MEARENGSSLSWRPILFENVKTKNWEFSLEACIVTTVPRQLAVEVETASALADFWLHGPNSEQGRAVPCPSSPHVILFDLHHSFKLVHERLYRARAS